MLSAENYVCETAAYRVPTEAQLSTLGIHQHRWR